MSASGADVKALEFPACFGYPIDMSLDRRTWGALAFFAGLAGLVYYWFAVRPPDPSWLGYSDDIGNMELARVLMSDSLREHGRPAFVTRRMMAPDGISVPYFSWMMERDWIGAYLWNWAPAFPWLWVYLGLSLLASYLVSGWIMTRMRITPVVAWTLAALFVLFNLSRHYKLYYHYEHALQHWIYFSLFLDAWIAQRLWRENRVSLHLELWRAVCLLGMLGTMGYYWGPLILEWGAMRIAMAAVFLNRRKLGQVPALEISRRKALLPVLIGIFFLALDLRWFLPLSREMSQFGEVSQVRGLFATFRMIFRPLWLEPLLQAWGAIAPSSAETLGLALKNFKLAPLDGPETIVTVGWIYLIPMALSLWLIRKRRGGPGIGLALPFFLTWAFAVFYARPGYFYHGIVAMLVPFMKYFRTASRMGLIFVPLCGVIIAVAWPDLSRWVRENWSRSRAFRAACFAFAALSAIELSALATPIVTIPPLTAEMSRLLADVRTQPGSTVLDMPFCVAGGNAACTSEFCAKYPHQTLPLYLTARHGKKVFGIYQGRMNDTHCATYRQPPYGSWVEAWRADRCLTPPEWEGLCSYLARTSDISALLIYPGIWTAAASPGCAQEFDRRLGKPRGRAEIATFYRRGPVADSDKPESIGNYWPTSVLWYGAKCQTAGH